MSDPMCGYISRNGIMAMACVKPGSHQTSDPHLLQHFWQDSW